MTPRYEKKDDKYPCKLRLYPAKGKRKYYLTGHDFTKEEFKKTWETKRPKKEYQEPRLELQAIEYLANSIIKKLNTFSFEEFEQLFFKGKVTKDINFYYDRTIINNSKNGQISTADNYRLALKSLQLYTGRDSITFTDITPQWLQGYEKYMVEDNKKSPTTVSIYIRTLRTVFNDAIAENAVSPEEYPFGKRRYNVPNPRGIKKALSKEQLKILFDAKPSSDEKQKAKDFWFFSYVCNVMNFKDIAHLKYRNLSEDTLTFMRAKTASTNSDQSPVVVYLADFAKQVISKYGSSDKSQDNYIFQIVEPRAEPSEKHRQVKNFVRFVNQHFSKFAHSAGINEHVSTYWARHSFATNAIRSGASMEYVSEALSHSSMNTTRGYFAGFDDEKKKEIAKKLMEF